MTLTAVGSAALAAATNAAQLNLQEVRLGSGHNATPATATALQTPIAASVYAVQPPGMLERYAAISRIDSGTLTIEAIDHSTDALTPTEMGLYDGAGVLLAYTSVATGNLFNKATDSSWQVTIRVSWVNQNLAAITYNTGAILPATTTRAGIVELATEAEVSAGTDNTRAVTPASLGAAAQLPAGDVDAERGYFAKREDAADGYELVDMDGQIFGQQKEYAGRLNDLTTEGLYRGVQALGSASTITGGLAKDYPVDTLYSAIIIVLGSRSRYMQMVINVVEEEAVVSTESRYMKIWLRTVDTVHSPDRISRWFVMQTIPPIISTLAASGVAPNGTVWYRVSA